VANQFASAKIDDCGTVKLDPHGAYWKVAGMFKDNEDETFFATMHEPTNIENIALFSFGRHGSSASSSDDFKNVVSGA